MACSDCEPGWSGSTCTNPAPAAEPPPPPRTDAWTSLWLGGYSRRIGSLECVFALRALRPVMDVAAPYRTECKVRVPRGMGKGVLALRGLGCLRHRLARVEAYTDRTECRVGVSGAEGRPLGCASALSHPGCYCRQTGKHQGWLALVWGPSRGSPCTPPTPSPRPLLTARDACCIGQTPHSLSGHAQSMWPRNHATAGGDG